MPINWSLVDKALFPIKGYADLCKRLKESFSFDFVREKFNYPIAALREYTKMGIGSDPAGRYNVYAARLDDVLTALESTGVKDLTDLVSLVITPKSFETLAVQSSLSEADLAAVMKYLVYWFIPGNKYLSGLVRPQDEQPEILAILKTAGIRTNLDLLERAAKPAGRASLGAECELDEEIILEWVNRADLSRMPWASKATISNILGAGYRSLKAFAEADQAKLVEDFYRYGNSIGKNLKHGNEVENSQRIARILPAIVG